MRMMMMTMFMIAVPGFVLGAEDLYESTVKSIEDAIEKADKEGPDPKNPFVDLIEKQISEASSRECEKRYTNLMKRIDCSVEIEMRFLKSGFVRGNKYYAKKHYGTMSNTELVSTYEKLYELAISDDAPPEYSSNKVGLVTVGDIKEEMAWIHKELMRRKAKFKPRITVY